MNYTSYIRDGFLAWTLTSNGYKYLTWNFILHWRRAVPGHPILVVCADKPSYQFLHREGIQCVLIESVLQDFGATIVPFGSKQFSILNRLKLQLLSRFAQDEAVRQCLYIDGDIIVYKDIVQEIRQRLTEKAIWMQCDEQQPDACSGDGSSDIACTCPNYCSGLIAWNHGADCGIFPITDETVWSAKPEDQVWVNYQIAQKGVIVGSLPRTLYPNGARVRLTHQSVETKAEAICLHYNYRVGKVKQVDMKRFGDWLLPY